MKIETTYETDIETRIYASDPEWSCGLDDQERVQLGVYASLSNVEEYGGEYPEGFPIICQFNVVVHDPAISDGVLQSLDLDLRDLNQDDSEKQAQVVREMLQEYGSSGVPVDDVLVRGTRSPGENDALRALLEGLEGAKIVDSYPHPFKKKTPYEVPWFSSWEDAETFAKRAFERIPGVMGLIGFVLDKPVNAIGADGWSMIRAQVSGHDWNPMPVR